MKDPMSIVSTRGNTVEEEFLVSATVVKSKKIIACWGDPNKVVFPRSALKPIQAIPMEQDLSLEYLALACSSHNGEKDHVYKIKQWLKNELINENELLCPPADPENPKILNELIKNKESTTMFHSSCSGKHVSMLLLSKKLKDSKKYNNVESSTQKLILDTIRKYCEFEPHIIEKDGCGVPAVGLPMYNLALGYLNLSRKNPKIIKAMRTYPHLVAGTGRIDTMICNSTSGKVLVKTGASGQHVVMIPDYDISITIKQHDGGYTGSVIALTNILKNLNILTSTEITKLRPYFEKNVLSNDGGVVGRTFIWSNI